MWQAHSRPATIAWPRDRKPDLVYRGLSTSVGRFLVFFLLLIAGVSHASERLSDKDAGADAIYSEPSIQSRVLGGGNAEVGAWPSMAAIVITGTFPLEDRFFCGGTVIGDRWVLTAAHCMFGPFGAETQPAEIRVVVGISDLQDESATEVVVSNIFLHPLYNTAGGTLQNDIALLELANVVTVPVTTLFEGSTETVNDSLAFIVGWGATEVNQVNSSDIYPNLLHDASVPLVSLARCNSPESYQGSILNTQVCAGFRDGGVDSCVGDSGGPLYLIQNGEQVQVGITSFGNGCGLPDFYGVYTNISAFRVWISDYINLPDSANPKAVVAADSAGSAHPLLLSLLAGFTILLRIRTSLSSRSRHRSSGHSRRIYLLVAASLSASACSSNPPLPENIDATKATLSQNNATVIDGDKELSLGATKLSLSGVNGKVGLNQLLLGSTRLETMQALSNSGFEAPVCDVDKTSIKGTGRLFLREQCQAQPLGNVSLEGLDVDDLTFQILDDRLIKLEVNLQSGDAMPLTSQLDVRYEHVPSAKRPFEWRLGGDHIRIVASDTSTADGVSGMSLQMIDGRLKDKLPQLFDYP